MASHWTSLLLSTLLSGSVCRGANLPPHHPQHHAPRELLDRIARSNPLSLTGSDDIVSLSPNRPYRKPFKEGLRITPTLFGGDPTGQKDSWEALNACLQHCLNQSALSPNGYFPGEDTNPSFGPIRDMGGCNIDLDGGEYRISKTLTLPEMNANMQFGRGSLVATPDFVGDFLFVVGTAGASCSVPQGSCNIDINFPELFLDGAKVTSGLQINHVMGVTIGPGGYFLNFTQYGLQINAGHEVMMDRCWLGETNFDYNHEKEGVEPNATAIQINGNDHYILNTIVFSSKIGLEVHGAADYIQGVHVWFPMNHAVFFRDTIAFHVTGSGNRFNGCYMDGGRAIFENSAVKTNIWTNGFECCQGAAPFPGTTASGITLVGDTIGPGLQIMNNEFGGGSIYHCSSAAYAAYNCTGETTMLQQRRQHELNCSMSFNVSVANRECEGLREAPSAATLEECADACCKDGLCTAYQWCQDGSKCDGATGNGSQCWLGKIQDCDAGTRKGWVGMGVGGASRPSPPTTVEGVRIEDNSFSHNARSSKGTQSLTQKNATQWNFDFCSSLIFPQIASAKIHVMAESGFPVAVARPTQTCTLLVETSIPMTGTITVEVDSSNPSDDFQ